MLKLQMPMAEIGTNRKEGFVREGMLTRMNMFLCLINNYLHMFTGPKFAGCLDVLEASGEICDDTPHGCCPDGVTAASGPYMEGCDGDCSVTLYGCCPPPNEKRAAHGPENFECDTWYVYPPKRTVCGNTLFGCCPDGVRAAEDENGKGCDAIVDVDCNETPFRCCPDGVDIAFGPNFEGCSTGCEDTEFGCCPDGKNVATSEDFGGCEDEVKVIGCDETQYGCCPDTLLPAHGPNLRGCNITRFEPQCDMTTYGCCPDGQTVASGEKFEGCSEEGSYVFSCRDSPSDCCPDGETPADGPHNAGCPSLVEGGGKFVIKS